MNILLENLNIHKSFSDFISKESIISELDTIIKKIGKPIYSDKLLDEKFESDIEKYFFPCADRVLLFLKSDLSNIKYIILGMDPYPSYCIEDDKIKPIATGRSFDVSNITSWKQKIKQSSLVNILKTLYFDKYKIKIDINKLRELLLEIENENDLKNINKKDNQLIILSPPFWFNKLEEEGVLFLNSTLTVKALNSSSHIDIWKYFMDELIKYILNYKKINLKENIKWIVWGENAKNRVKDFVDEKDIIYSCHPATRVNNNFIENDCFKIMKNINLYY